MEIEIKIARGKTAKQLTKDATRIAAIRDKEIKEEVEKGYDVYSRDCEWFEPCGVVSLVDD